MDSESAITKTAVTYPITVAAATTTTVRAIGAGLRFHIMGLFLRANGAETVVFQSEGNALSGAITFADAQELHLPVGKVPHMSGRATGEDFKITTGIGAQISGWATIAEEK